MTPRVRMAIASLFAATIPLAGCGAEAWKVRPQVPPITAPAHPDVRVFVRSVRDLRPELERDGETPKLEWFYYLGLVMGWSTAGNDVSPADERVTETLQRELALAVRNAAKPILATDSPTTRSKSTSSMQ